MPGNRPMNATSPARHAGTEGSGDRGAVARWLAPPLPWAVLTFALAAAAGWPKTLPLIADSVAYRAMALGRFSEVLGSISGRVLHPFIVQFVSWTFGLNVDQAFLVVAVATLALLIVTVAWMLRQITGFGAMVLPLLLTPVLINEMFGLYYCQDLFYAALLGCFFIVLIKGHKGLALALLLPLFLARESTILLAFAWAVIAWFETDYFVVAICGAVTTVGFYIARKFAALGIPNVHHTNELVFLALKPPVDGLKNFFGIVLVPNEMRGKPGYNCIPWTIIHLPRLLSYGSTREFGICRCDPGIPLHTFTLWLSLFGIGPALFCALFKRNGRRMLEDTPLWLKLATIYGLLCFFIAPLVSNWLERDIGYAWPVFWLAVPALLMRFYSVATPGVITALLLENLAACWIPYALGLSSIHQGLFAVAALCIALAMQAAALWTIKLNRIGTAAEERLQA